MDQEYQIVYEEKPEESAWGIIGRGVATYNKEQAGDDSYTRLCFVLQGPDQEVVGGIIGATYWDWFYLDLLWVKEDLRRQGYGQQLLSKSEDIARERGAKNVFLDTFSFQAPEFYQKYGYQVYGELPDFPTGHQRFFLTKQL
jgi:ribosomal protein S18 acetylase RimI-like enzyme